MKKIGVLTFHSAYNYGSSLQAYALQEFCRKICNESNVDVDFKIINLRKKSQQEQYAIFRKKVSKKNVIRNIMNLPYYKKIKQKNEKFEIFINNQLSLTSEINEEKDLNSLDMDYYITGSDQIWNITAIDFSLAYYLPFVKKGKKISYAASFGQSIDKIKGEKQLLDLLNKYDCISVREEKSKIFLEDVLKKKNIDVHVDPTFLLDKKVWNDLINTSNFEIPKRDYVLFYTLYPEKRVMQITKKLVKSIGLTVVTTKYNNQNDYFNSFKKIYNTGPIEFLKLLKNAKYVITSSFHGCVFSIIFNKPFFVIRNGKKDLRLENILKKTGLEDRIINSIEDIELIMERKDKISFENANQVLEEERAKSKKYLLSSLDIIKSR